MQEVLFVGTRCLCGGKYHFQNGYHATLLKFLETKNLFHNICVFIAVVHCMKNKCLEYILLPYRLAIDYMYTFVFTISYVLFCEKLTECWIFLWDSDMKLLSIHMCCVF